MRRRRCRQIHALYQPYRSRDFQYSPEGINPDVGPYVAPPSDYYQYQRTPDQLELLNLPPSANTIVRYRPPLPSGQDPSSREWESERPQSEVEGDPQFLDDNQPQFPFPLHRKFYKEK
jgi:hypothetical protein